MNWISADASSETVASRLPQDEEFSCAINNVPHAEERLKGASRSTHDASATNPFAPFCEAGSRSRSKASGNRLFRRHRLAVRCSRHQLVPFSQHRLERSLDFAKLCRMLNLMAEQVLDVKHIDDLFTIG